MNKYSQAVIAKKPEFSYLDTPKPLKSTYSDGTVNPYNPEVFPYAKDFMYTILKRVNETYAAIVEDENRQILCKELYQQLKHDFRFDFSDHLGPMRQRDKRGAEPIVEDNDYNMFHSGYKFVNQAARAYSFGEKFNLSLMSGRVNTDNQTGPEICDPFIYGPPLYLYSKNYPKVVAMTLPGFDTPEKIATLKMHEKEMKKDMFAKKSEVAKEVKGHWHHLINKEFMPEGMEFKDLSVESVKKISALHTEMLTQLSTRIENQFQSDVKMLNKVMNILNKQMMYNQEQGKPADDLACLQLASIHAMQANNILKDSSVIQVSVEAEKPIYQMMADIMDNPDSLTYKIFNNPDTRQVFETEMKKIHTTKSDVEYNSLLDKMEPMGSKMPAFSRMMGNEYNEDMSREEMADKMRKGEAMPKVSFMLAVILMEAGAKIEGGSSQIVYARKIKQALEKVFEEAAKHPEFDKQDLNNRYQIFSSFDYRTVQAQIWGVKENGSVLGYKDLINGTVKVNNEMLDKIGNIRSQDAFEAASVHRFYTFMTNNSMSEEELSTQKNRVKNNLMSFEDKGDYASMIKKGGKYYNKLASLIKSDENISKANSKTTTYTYNRFQNAVGY